MPWPKRRISGAVNGENTTMGRRSVAQRTDSLRAGVNTANLEPWSIVVRNFISSHLTEQEQE
jgi:hypothetical protein